MQSANRHNEVSVAQALTQKPGKKHISRSDKKKTRSRRH